MIRVATLNLYERSLASSLPAALPLPDGVALMVQEGLAAGDLPEGLRHREAQARLAAGQACAAVHARGAIVAYCWSTTAPASVEEIRCHVVPREDEVYLYDAYTAPEWRGQRLFPAMLAALLGMTPENLSRAFATLRPYGVRVDGPTIRLDKVDDLQVLAKPTPLIDDPKT